MAAEAGNHLARTVTRARKALRLLRRPVWRRGLLRGVAATIEHSDLAGLVTPRTVIDIGANKGQFTLFALEAWPGCAVHAFEPQPAAAARFRAALRGHPAVTLHEAAVGPVSGEATMHLSQRADSSSLLPIGERQAELFPGTAAAGSLTVSVRTLEEALDNDSLRAPALLKIDVQGFELEALRGCASLLPLIEYVYVECSYIELYTGQALFEEIQAFLDRHGLRFRREFNVTTRPQSARFRAIACSVGMLQPAWPHRATRSHANLQPCVDACPDCPLRLSPASAHGEMHRHAC